MVAGSVSDMGRPLPYNDKERGQTKVRDSGMPDETKGRPIIAAKAAVQGMSPSPKSRPTVLTGGRG